MLDEVVTGFWRSNAEAFSSRSKTELHAQSWRVGSNEVWFIATTFDGIIPACWPGIYIHTYPHSRHGLGFCGE